MRIEKALIIRRLNNAVSMQYAEDCAKSCQQHKLPYEFIDAIEDKNCNDAFEAVGMEKDKSYKNTQGDCCCHASHIKCWKRIVELGHACIILEHDAIIKGPVNTVNIPDMAAVTFGFRVAHVDDYTPPNEEIKLEKLKRSVGVHACGLTPKSAQRLLDYTKENKVCVGVDRLLFMEPKVFDVYGVDPPQAVCWVRASTTHWNRTKDFINGGKPRHTIVNYKDGITKGFLKGLTDTAKREMKL